VTWRVEDGELQSSLRNGRVAALSTVALVQVCAAYPASVAEAALRLYSFGRLPFIAWRRAGYDDARLHAELATAASPAWVAVASGPPDGPWWAWRPRHVESAPTAGGWKLYVSPQPHRMIDAVRATLNAAADLPVVSAKCGGDAQGLLRPDKIVVHLQSRAAIDALAARLVRALQGCSAHGVPFTAELGGDGLLSWGRDPPPDPAHGRQTLSWRTWITWRLAEGLMASAPVCGDPCAEALKRIAAAGVDARTWAPVDDIFARRIAV
jgi:hypothetical protein